MFLASAGSGLGGARFRLEPNAAPGTTTAPAAPAAPAAGQAHHQAPANVNQTAGAAAPGTGAPAGFDMAGLATLIGQNVSQAVNGAMAATNARVEQLATTVAQMAAPQNPNAAAIAAGTAGAPGSAPAIRQGENILTSRGYSYGRMLQCVGGMMQANQAKVEGEISERLYKIYRGNQLVQGNGWLVPVASEHIHDEAIRQEIREISQAGLVGTDRDDARQVAQMRQQYTLRGLPRDMQQALSIHDETALGIFLDIAMGGELIPLLRAQEVMSRAGAREITLPINGRMAMGAQVGAQTAYWVGTGAAGVASRALTTSDPATGARHLMARKLGCLCRVPMDLVRFSTRAVELFLRQDMATVMALEESSTFLTNTAATDLKPKGLLAYSGIKTVLASTLGTDGNTIEPEDVDALAAEIEEANVPMMDDNFTLIMRPKLRAALATRRADAVTAADGKGPYVFLDMALNAMNGNRDRIHGYRALRSTQVPVNRSKGSGTALTMVFGGDFSQFIIGRHGVMEFATATQGDTMFQNDEMYLRGIGYVDGIPRYEEAFGIIDTLING